MQGPTDRTDLNMLKSATEGNIETVLLITINGGIIKWKSTVFLWHAYCEKRSNVWFTWVRHWKQKYWWFLSPNASNVLSVFALHFPKTLSFFLHIFEMYCSILWSPLLSKHLSRRSETFWMSRGRNYIWLVTQRVMLCFSQSEGARSVCKVGFIC